MEQLFQPETLAILMVFGIPLAAIIGTFYMKAKKLELEAQKNSSGSDTETTRELLAELKRLHATNADMARRLERLEANQLGTPSSVDDEGLRQQRNLERN